MSNVIHVNEQSFDKVVLNYEGVVLVDFWAPWCGPCKALGPILDKVSEKVSHRIVKVNVDDEGNLANKYKIRSIPTMIIFKNGQIVDTMVGLASEDALINKISSFK